MSPSGENLMKFAEKANEINSRYDNDRRAKDRWGIWTPKQRRRVYKQKAKWHRRLLGGGW